MPDDNLLPVLSEHLLGKRVESEFTFKGQAIKVSRVPAVETTVVTIPYVMYASLNFGAEVGVPSSKFWTNKQLLASEIERHLAEVIVSKDVRSPERKLGKSPANYKYRVTIDVTNPFGNEDEAPCIGLSVENVMQILDLASLEKRVAALDAKELPPGIKHRDQIMHNGVRYFTFNSEHVSLVDKLEVAAQLGLNSLTTDSLRDPFVLLTPEARKLLNGVPVNEDGRLQQPFENLPPDQSRHMLEGLIQNALMIEQIAAAHNAHKTGLPVKCLALNSMVGYEPQKHSRLYTEDERQALLSNYNRVVEERRATIEEKLRQLSDGKPFGDDTWHGLCEELGFYEIKSARNVEWQAKLLNDRLAELKVLTDADFEMRFGKTKTEAVLPSVGLTLKDDEINGTVYLANEAAYAIQTSWTESLRLLYALARRFVKPKLATRDTDNSSGLYSTRGELGVVQPQTGANSLESLLGNYGVSSKYYKSFRKLVDDATMARIEYDRLMAADKHAQWTEVEDKVLEHYPGVEPWHISNSDYAQAMRDAHHAGNVSVSFTYGKTLLGSISRDGKLLGSVDFFRKIDPEVNQQYSGGLLDLQARIFGLLLDHFKSDAEKLMVKQRLEEEFGGQTKFTIDTSALNAIFQRDDKEVEHEAMFTLDYSSDEGLQILDHVSMVSQTLMAHWPGTRGTAGFQRQSLLAVYLLAKEREGYFSLLGLKPGASQNDIRSAWQRKMFAVHPDTAGIKLNSTQIMEVIDAKTKLMVTPTDQQRFNLINYLGRPSEYLTLLVPGRPALPAPAAAAQQ